MEGQLHWPEVDTRCRRTNHFMQYRNAQEGKVTLMHWIYLCLLMFLSDIVITVVINKSKTQRKINAVIFGC